MNVQKFSTLRVNTIAKDEMKKTMMSFEKQGDIEEIALSSEDYKDFRSGKLNIHNDLNHICVKPTACDKVLARTSFQHIARVYNVTYPHSQIHIVPSRAMIKPKLKFIFILITVCLQFTDHYKILPQNISLPMQICICSCVTNIMSS